jgi:hypothetical protein
MVSTVVAIDAICCGFVGLVARPGREELAVATRLAIWLRRLILIFASSARLAVILRGLIGPEFSVFSGRARLAVLKARHVTVLAVSACCASVDERGFL